MNRIKRHNYQNTDLDIFDSHINMVALFLVLPAETVKLQKRTEQNMNLIITSLLKCHILYVHYTFE